MADRSKYKKASPEEMAQQAEEMKAREQTSNSATFLKVEPGINKFRIFPAPLKAESSLFCYPKVTSFLPIMVDEKDDDGKKTGRQVEKRKAIFNAKVHGGLSIDVVEAYIEAAREKFAATIKDKKELLKKLQPITDWKTGIKPSSSYICYAIKYSGDGQNKVYGRLQLTDGVKKQLDSLCLREGKSGAPIVVDLFSDPDSGKPFQWSSNPNAEDAKSRNKINILFEEDFRLTDEELEMLEGWDSLESLYTNSYTKKDFENQVKGLQLFDKKLNLNIFESPSFQSILESAKEEVEEKLGSEEESEENEEKEEKKPIVKKPVKKEEPSEEESTIPEILEDMDKKTLMSLPKLLELKDLEVKTTTPPSKLRKMIKEAIVATYELEGTDAEINESITDIISDSLEGEGNEGESAPAEEPEEKEEPKKGGSLLDKYRTKK